MERLENESRAAGCWGEGRSVVEEKFRVWDPQVGPPHLDLAGWEVGLVTEPKGGSSGWVGPR